METFVLVIAMLGIILAGSAIVMGERRYRKLKRRFEFQQAAIGDHHRILAAIYGAIAEQRLALAARKPRFPIEFTADFADDILLYELFAGKPDGFFIECGAYDGKRGSVTYPFEAIGWTGLLVEPGRAAHQACTRHRPASTVLHAALSKRGSTGLIDFVEVDSGDQSHSGARSHVSNASTPRRMPAGDKLVATQVLLTTMDQALSSHHGPIDLAVIDVEGHEPELFDGFDLERFRPRVMLVEEDPLGSRPELFASLRSRGYDVVGTIGWNRLLVRRDEPELIARARALGFEPA